MQGDLFFFSGRDWVLGAVNALGRSAFANELHQPSGQSQSIITRFTISLVFDKNW